MIETIKDEQGKITAYIEWNLLDQYGHFDNDGKYVWINDLYIQKDLRGNGILKRLSLDIRKLCPQAEEFYFKRHKYKDRVRQYKIKDYLKED